ncbi:MAG TPA: response regulator transcription factor [bacterium]|nr:response regulator transcription factor [bacterium]
MEKGQEKILVADLSSGSPDSIADSIKREGFHVIEVTDADLVKDTAVDQKPKAILINCDGFDSQVWELCKSLKDDFYARKSTMIIISNSSDESDVVRAIQLGADDYVITPFSTKALIARMKAVIDRLNRHESKKIRVKDIEIDLDEHRVKKSGKPIDLTYIQFKLLYLLASRRESVFSRKEILEKVWGRKVYVTNRTVDVHIKRLREKLGEYKYPSQYIETIHGTGYRFL